MMTFSIWCVFVAFLIPYPLIIAAKWAAPEMNNETPRLALAKLTGWRARAHWAHQNAFENFPPYAVALCLAHANQAPVAIIHFYALTFVIARVLYSLCYVTNRSTLRSLAYFVGFFSVIRLFVLAAMS